MRMLPEILYDAGFIDLVSVIPPNAKLSPGSLISPTMLGKTPGLQYPNGLWGGYNWLAHKPSEDDVRKWALAGSNFGLVAGNWPAVDIDVLDPRLSQLLQGMTLKALGPAPLRVGRAPKALFMYRLKEGSTAFGRMALKIRDANGAEHLIEILGARKQYLIAGTHPSGTPYSWDRPIEQLKPSDLTQITEEDAERFLAQLAADLPLMGYEVERLGTANAQRGTTAQEGLLAPTREALEELVAKLPNRDDVVPDREAYIKVGYAIRAAGQDLEDEGESIFLAWAARHEGDDGRVAGNPETARSDWRRMKGPYTLGWPWLVEKARPHGYSDLALDFTPVAPDQADEVRAASAAPPRFSDQDLADEVVKDHGAHIRFVPGWKRYVVWDGTRWATDALSAAEHKVGETLRRLAIPLLTRGGTAKEQKENLQEAKRLCGATTRDNTTKFVKTEPRLVVEPRAFDADPWQLNTPAGIIDLKTGRLHPHTSTALLTKCTAVGADIGGPCPEWKRFLAETTGNDRELESYLQRLAGYCLTGVTREQALFFVHGPGGNGKSVFLNTLSQLMGDYASQAPMDMFTAAQTERHSTDLAGMQGARLVAASETQAGRRWDETRVKALTGGDPITARFLYANYFTFIPQFKLLFVGNHRPAIRDIDQAIRRRIQLVPFTVTPARVDPDLTNKLREEWPAILGWAVEGCLQWQQKGMTMPAVVGEATRDYFTEEDAIGRWITEACTIDAQASVSTNELFEHWRQWANANGEFVGSTKRFSQALIAKKFTRWSDPNSRRMGFLGLRLEQTNLEDITQ